MSKSRTNEKKLDLDKFGRFLARLRKTLRKSMGFSEVPYRERFVKAMEARQANVGNPYPQVEERGWYPGKFLAGFRPQQPALSTEEVELANFEKKEHLARLKAEKEAEKRREEEKRRKFERQRAREKAEQNLSVITGG